MTDSETSASETTVGVGAPSESTAFSHEPGSSVGRYLVIEEVGRGGMGVVLRAYDPKLQREVALKSVRTEAMSEAAQARMVQEARAMAKLSHPNVVSVYDVELELEPGQGVVLAMEYVPGATLRKWIDKDSPSWAEVVEAFIEAGRGLAAAHAAGLLHRDFKPANVLVGGAELPEGQRVVKVTDFGLALPQETLGSVDPDASADRSVGELQSGSNSGIRSDSGHERLTELGTLVGTPAYMAPEQHDGAELGVHADQYAYCVSLWQGLTGELPFPQRGAKLAKAKLEVPKWPSSGSSVPKAIVDAVRRGLAPNPDDRWPSMEELLEAIDYDSGKARGNLLTGLGVVAAAGVVASAWAFGQGRSDACVSGEAEIEAVWNDARRGEAEAAFGSTGLAYAPTVWGRVGTQIDGYATRWSAMHRDSCEATTLRGEQSAAVMELRMTCLSYAKAELAAAVDLMTSPDATVAENAHRVVDELQPIDRCVDVEALQNEAVEAPDPAAVQDAMNLIARARVLTLAGRSSDALEITAGLTETVEGLEYGPLQVRWEMAAGLAAQHQGDYTTSDEQLGLALEHGLQFGQWEDAKFAAHLLAVTVGEHRARPDEAMVYLETAWGLQGRNEADTEGAARLHYTHGELARGQGEFETAQTQLAAAIEIWGGKDADAPAKLARTRHRLSRVLASAGKLEQAEAELESAIALVSASLGDNHPWVGALHLTMAQQWIDRGMLGQAKEQLEAVRRTVSNTQGKDHPIATLSSMHLSRIDARQGNTDAARSRLEAQLAVIETEDSLTPALRNELGNVLRSEGKIDEAEPYHRQALEAWEKNLGEEHPRVAEALYGLGHIEQARGKNTEAQELLERARRVVDKAGTPPRVGTRVGFLLAQVMWELGEDPGKSRGLAEQARASGASDSGIPESFVKEVDAWLAAHPVPDKETDPRPDE